MLGSTRFGEKTWNFRNPINLTHLGQVRLGQVKKIFFLKNVRIDVIWRENLEFSKSDKPNSPRLGQVWVWVRFFWWKQLSRSILELEQCSQAPIDRASFTCVCFGQQLFGSFSFFLLLKERSAQFRKFWYVKA